jgi:hypothetical protein
MPTIRVRSATSAALAAALVAVPLAGGCGRDSDGRRVDKPLVGLKGSEEQAADDLGFPAFATKNTTRVGGADGVANAAGVARAVYSGGSALTRPKAIALADAGDWRAALATAVLMAPPIRAPLILTDGRELPAASERALAALAPTGSAESGGAQVIRVGAVARPKGLKSTDIAGRDAFALARRLDALQAAVRGKTSDTVLVVSADEPAFAMPAAGWAAKSGDPVLFAKRDVLPPATRAAIAAHQRPKIYVLGPSKVIGPKVTRSLRKLGRVTRIGGKDPVRNAIAFAKFVDGPFGWGVVDPGHGLVFANQDRPLDAAAAAPLSGSGTYGPLLILDDAGEVPPALEEYLLDIQPGYRRDPVRAFYNHGWIVGDDKAISVATQSRIDALLEIVPVNEKKGPSQ